MDFFFHKTADFRVAELKFKGNQDVKYNIGMGRALYNPEIMEIQRLVQFMEAAGDLLFQFLGLFIVIHNRIHMYYRVTVQLTILPMVSCRWSMSPEAGTSACREIMTRPGP